MKRRNFPAFLATFLAFAATATVQAKDIVITHVGTLTGPAGSYGTSAFTGFKMGLEHLTNGSMQVNGNKIVLIQKDDQGKPDLAKALVTGAYSDDKSDIEKMRRTWSSMDEYIRYYESSKLYPHGVDEYGRAHFEYDLTGTPPALRTKILEACVAPDWRDVLDHAAVSERLKRVNVPLLLLRAPEGLTGNGDPVVPDDVRDEIVARVKGTTVVDIAGTNHHTILTSRAGAAIVAREIRTFTQDQ